MKTCPQCGAPQADTLTKCNLCGCLFQSEKAQKPRLEKRGLIALVSDFMSIAGTIAFFFCLSLDSYYYNSFSQAIYHIVIYTSVFFGAAGPIAGLIFSIVGLTKAKHREAKGKGFAIAGIVISSVLMPVALFFIYMLVLDITARI